MRDLALDTALASVGDDLYFSIVRLGAHPDTQPLAAGVTKLLAKVDATVVEQHGLQRSIAKADATAAGTRADVDGFVGDLQVTALGVCKQDRSDARFATLFPDAASTVQGYDEPKLRKWLDGVATALPKMAEKELQAHAAAAKKLLATWDTTEAAQAAAATANSQHDASVRTPLRLAVNAARRDLFADLTKLATKSQRSKRWLESFFRSGTVKKKAAVAA